MLVMLLGAFAACDNGEESSTQDGTSTPVENTTDAPLGGDTESDTETVTYGETETETEVNDKVELEGAHADFIQSSNEMANGVQAYFPDAYRTNYVLENREMSLNYSRNSINPNGQLVESLKNTKGESYIENTMDVYMKMADGSVFYSSASSMSAEVNLYRFGFYYYQAIFEFQNFLPTSFEVLRTEEIRARKYHEKGANDITFSAADNGGAKFTIDTGSDPYFYYTDFSFPCDTFDMLEVTMKGIGNTKSGVLYLNLNKTGYGAGITVPFSLNPDGEMATYYIPLYSVSGYEGTINGVRFDPNGSMGDGLIIEKIKFVQSSLQDVPKFVSTNRHFHVYSDKMHHAVQFATTQITENIAEVGIVTKIDASTVDKILIKTESEQYTSLDADIDWTQVESVGFDIKSAGIFGYILPVDAVAGNIKVTLEDGQYVITQWRVPENNTLIPSEKKTNNANDFYIGQRIYTDENHDFEEFLHETYCERNPLTEKDIRVNEAVSDNGYLKGYDAVRGTYVLSIGAPAGGFFTPYNTPNKNYKVNFTVRSKDLDRSIYIMTSATQGLLECAAIMDENMMMLPIPIEVIKNFSEAGGERNLFNLDDPQFSEAIFYMPLEKGEIYEYNILNLYQNWGKYPLKQLSQIPFHCPYYHLSTGVTETNCILPWFQTATAGKTVSNYLPDFRSMSAPFWKDQPQHNSCGSHFWLSYTDADGGSYSFESVTNVIDSFGPTYAELVVDNVSDDGKMEVTYTHMEMPQTDENRAYYSMELNVLEDVSINDFKNNFVLYKVTDNNATGVYKRVGYLDENNEYAVVAATEGDATAEYILGNECPYFSFFDMPDWDRLSDSAEGYANVAFLVYNSEFIIGGEKVEPKFVIINHKNYVTLTLDLGDVTLKAGDSMTLNCILLPWGSQELDGKYDEVQDSQVRAVRENTLLNPLTVTSETDEVIESVYVPRVRSADGKTAEFTLSGGENNVAVRVYGFDMLTVPKVQEFIDGEWVDYRLDSSETPDDVGYFHYYDGYCVYYDGDGTYSYSFVTTMTDGAPRRFRISADTAFAGWEGREFTPTSAPDKLDVYVDPNELYAAAAGMPTYFDTPVVSDDGTYVSIYAKQNSVYAEAYASIYGAPGDNTESGQYLVLKYRVPYTNKEGIGSMQFYTSTTESSASEGASFWFVPISDGEWHVAVIDLSMESGLKTFKETDGKYCARYIRFDVFNKRFSTPGNYVDIAYVGIDASLEEICKLNQDEHDTVTLYQGGAISLVSTKTYQSVNPYLNPESGYTQSTVAFGAHLDSICGKTVNLGSSSMSGITTYKGAMINKNYQISFKGWCAADGGITEYMYSLDGGITWTALDADKFYNASSGIVEGAEGKAKVTFADAETSKKNGAFQGAPVTIDLSDYKDRTVDVIIAAIPEKEPGSLMLLYCFEDVKCTLQSMFAESSEYTESATAYGAYVDFVNDTAIAAPSGSASGCYIVSKPVTVNEEYKFTVSGWCAADGGVDKYLWTADNGVTWNECGGAPITADGEIVRVGQQNAGATFADTEASKTRGSFQSVHHLVIDLSEYAGQTEPLTITIVALPQGETSTVCPLFILTSVSPVPAMEETAE